MAVPDHESSYRGAITLCTIAMAPEQLAAHVANEGPLQDQEFWRKIALMRVEARLARQMRQSLSHIATTLAAAPNPNLLPAADYVRRTAVEAFGNIPPAEAEERHFAMLDEPAIAA